MGEGEIQAMGGGGGEDRDRDRERSHGDTPRQRQAMGTERLGDTVRERDLTTVSPHAFPDIADIVLKYKGKGLTDKKRYKGTSFLFKILLIHWQSTAIGRNSR